MKQIIIYFFFTKSFSIPELANKRNFLGALVNLNKYCNYQIYSIFLNTNNKMLKQNSLKILVK